MERRLGSSLAAIATNITDAFIRRGYELADGQRARYDADSLEDVHECLRINAGVVPPCAVAEVAAADVAYVEGTSGALEALRAFCVRVSDGDSRVLVLVADVQHASYASRGVAHADAVVFSAASVAHAFQAAETDVGEENAATSRLVLVLWHAPPGPFTPDARLTKQLLKHASRFRSVELFTRSELLIDVFTHALQPPIIRLVAPANARELEWLEREYAQLHGLERNDPIVRRLALEPGAVLEFVRSSARLGATHVFRRVLGATVRQRAAERDRWRAVVVTTALRASETHALVGE